jgi:transposase-like protein
MSTHNPRSGSKERFWRRMVRQWRSSGLSVRAFCAQHELAEPTFYAWRRTIAERDALIDNGAPAFLAVQVTRNAETPRATADDATAGLEVVLRSGRRLRVGSGFDGPTLQRLLALLEEGQS